MSQAEPATREFTIFDDGRPLTLEGSLREGRVLLSPESVRETLGWEVKPEGLCRGEVCIPVRKPESVVRGQGIDLEGLADAIGRPLAIDPAEAIAALGVRALDRAESLATLVAPDFSLPDLSGRMHKLSDYRGKKILLIAYASW